MNIFRRHGLKKKKKQNINLLQFYCHNYTVTQPNDCFQDVSKSNKNTVLRAVKFKEILQIKIIGTLKGELASQATE